VRDYVSRLSIHIVRTLLGNSKIGKLASPPSSKKFAPSSLLSRPRHLGRSLHCLPVGKSPHRLPIGKSSHHHCPSPSRPWHHPPLQATNSHELFYLSYQKTETKIYYKKSMVIAWFGAGVDPDVLDSNIFGTWFCRVLTMKFFDHFGNVSKISSRFPSSFAYFIALPMYKIF